MTGEEVRNTIETWLSTLTNRPGMETIEIAFFGGSFTGIPMEQQSAYLEIAQDYKQRGLVHKIHLSTRPDYIDQDILDNLKAYGTDTIELGVQSFDEKVLEASGRGHDSSCVYEAASLIQSYGFELGIQLMIGLPEDSLKKCLYSARETVKIGPSIARLYPTIVIEGTHLMDMYKKGLYAPLTTEEAVSTTKEMYKILMGAGINIIRVGLKSSDLIRDGGQISGHTFHPAFRQLVEGEIAREKMIQLIEETSLSRRKQPEPASVAMPCWAPYENRDITFFSNPTWFSCMIGHKARNKKYMRQTYPGLTIRYQTHDLPDGSIAIAVADDPHLVVK